MRRAYLAGPEVFLPDAAEIGRGKQALCAEFGFIGLLPSEQELPKGDGLDLRIYRAIVALMRSADFGVFNLTPFRGPSADVGTVFELGMMIALGKPVFGYTNAAEGLLERVRRSEPIAQDADGIWRDRAGMRVEDFGNADNLMITAALCEAGSPIIRPQVPSEASFRDLRGFTECLARAVVRFR